MVFVQFEVDLARRIHKRYNEINFDYNNHHHTLSRSLGLDIKKNKSELIS